MDEFNMFIIENINVELAQYTPYKPKEITGLLKKTVFKIVTTANIPTYAQIFNFYFVYKVNNLVIDKA